MQRVILLILLAGALLLMLGASVQGSDLSDLLLNLGTELVGALVTYLLVVRIISGKDEAEAAELEKTRLKADLVAGMSSQNRGTVSSAVEALIQHGWLYDGTLQGAVLDEANLQGMHLVGADLQRAILWRADLQGANLWTARLNSALLSGANLREAFLGYATLRNANLDSADLSNTDLQGAKLWGANLQKANLQNARLDESTKLPDGLNWTADTDMSRFTNPEHPDFWRSDDPESPAYRGNYAITD